MSESASDIDLSILVPTSTSRHAFWPWLAWNIQQQTRGLKLKVEIIIAWSAESDFAAHLLRHQDGVDIDLLASAFEELVDPHHVAWIWSKAAFTLGEKRQLLQSSAKGEFIAWMDDDDWHTPGWLDFSVTRMCNREIHWVVTSGITYYDLMSGGVWAPRAWRETPIPITAVVRREHSPDFSAKSEAEDVDWFRQLNSVHGSVLDAGWQMVALVHPLNTSKWLHQQRVQRSFADNPTALPVDFRSPEVAEQLEALRQRLLSQEK